MTIRLDYNNMMREFIGDEGITREELVAYRKSADKALGKLESEKGKGWLGWMDLPLHQREVVADINKTAKEIRRTAKYFVVLGIGGSALGPAAVQAAAHTHCFCGGSIRLFATFIITTSPLRREKRPSFTSRITSILKEWPRSLTLSTSKKPFSTL